MRQRETVNHPLLLLVGLLTILTSFVAGSPVRATSKDTTGVAPQGNFTPDQIIARAQTWANVAVAYSQDPPYHNGYRRDCSGFVTWACGLSASSSKGITTDNPGGGLN